MHNIPPPNFNKWESYVSTCVVIAVCVNGNGLCMCVSGVRGWMVVWLLLSLSLCCFFLGGVQCTIENSGKKPSTGRANGLIFYILFLAFKSFLLCVWAETFSVKHAGKPH
jgi:hypothetical protein